MKKFLVAWLATCIVSLVASPTFAALGDGLVSYWPLDGDLSDAAGSNDGVFRGTDPTAVYDSGAFEQGIDLDGIDQYVDAGNDASLDMSVGGAGAQTGSVSISAWLRVDGFSKGWQALIAKGEGEGFRVARRGESNVISYAGGSGDIPGSDIGPDINDGALHHVVAISENGVSTRLWVDGGLVATGDPPSIVNDGNGGDPNPVNPPLYIGENPQASGRTWDGLIDDVGIWNRPLSESEVMSIYKGQASGASLGQLIVPEPTALLLLGSGLCLLGIGRRR